jgi:hypothetical protein
MSCQKVIADIQASNALRNRSERPHQIFNRRLAEFIVADVQSRDGGRNVWKNSEKSFAAFTTEVVVTINR